MPGEGKYSNYLDKMPDEKSGGISSAKLVLLKKLFPTAPSLNKDDVLKRALENLTPAEQNTPDPAFANLNGKVNLNYAGSPNLNDVKFNSPGGPSTPYTPDIRSPGSAVPVDQLGSTDTTSINTNLKPASGDPDVAPADFHKNYVPGTLDSGTKSPALQTEKVASKVELGKSLPVSNMDDNSGGEIYK